MTARTARGPAAKRTSSGDGSRGGQKPPRPLRSRWRLATLWVMTLVGFTGLIYRVASLQISPSPRLQEESEIAREQRFGEVALPAARGAMFDRNGAELAISVPQTTVVADARAIEDAHLAAQILAPILRRDAAALEATLVDGQTRQAAFVYLARQVDDATAQAIEAARTEVDADPQTEGVLDFVSLYVEPKRFSASGDDLALSVLGRTDIDGAGISGLETQFQDRLVGVDGLAVVEVGTRNRTIPGGEKEVTPAEPGTNLVLTLDRALQYETEKLLKQAVDEQDARGGTIVVQDIRTGDILANANVVREEGGYAHEAQDNRALTWTFEPGSIAKTLTMAGVLEHGIATPSTPRMISAKFQVSELEFTDEGRSDAEMMTPTDILTRSSNNGTVTWAEELGKALLWSTFDNFGLGHTTGLDFPGESAGKVLPLTEWDDLTFRTMAYGLGFAATPMQMLDAYATIANQGVSVPTRYVLGTQSDDGVYTPAPLADGRRVVSEQTAQDLTAMLTNVVDNGTGRNARIAGFSVAGKTGTAWKARSGGGYGAPGDRDLVVSFAGYLPASDPQFAIIVVVDEPADPNSSGGANAAPLFADVASFAVQHLNVPPDADAAAPTSKSERVRAEPEGEGINGIPLGPPSPKKSR